MRSPHSATSSSLLDVILPLEPPDDELLDAIERGGWEPAVLGQVRRLLADSRRGLVDSFAGSGCCPHRRNGSRRHLPDFDGLRESLQRETELFLGSQLREDRGVVELLTANYVLNERLARHYGFRSRQQLPSYDARPRDAPRRLIGQGICCW
jgi:hypothetical protein